jgi:malate dehydrogenase
MRKITVIGAGNVGATCANVIAHKDLAAKLFWLISKKAWPKAKPLISGKHLPSTTLTPALLALPTII